MDRCRLDPMLLVVAFVAVLAGRPIPTSSTGNRISHQTVREGFDAGRGILG